MGQDDEIGLQVVRDFFSLANSKNWDGLVEKFGDHCNKVVGRPVGTPKDSLCKDFARYFDLSVKERRAGNAVVFEFETYTSFTDDDFIELLLSGGVKRIEASIGDSQVGMTYFYEDDEYLQDYHKTQWRWLPGPESLDDDE